MGWSIVRINNWKIRHPLLDATCRCYANRRLDRAVRVQEKESLAARGFGGPIPAFSATEVAFYLDHAVGNGSDGALKPIF
jgi:hypothetical protein